MTKTFVLVALTVFVGIGVTPAGADPKADAQKKIERAMQLHAEGKYKEALVDLTAAYELDPEPDLLYAIAQIHVKLEDCKQAIAYYEKFLATNPEAGPATAAREATDHCKKSMPAEPVAPPEPTPPPPTPSPVAEPVRAPPPQTDEPTHAWYKDPLGGALVGAGVVAGVVGIVFYTGARGNLDDAETAATYQAADDLIDNAKTKRTYSIVLGAGGAALVAGGIVRYLVVSGRDDSERGVAVTPTSGGGLVTWSGKF